MKKFVRFTGVALLALAIGGGCGGDDDPVTPVVPPAPPPAPPPIVGTVSGMVSVEGSGLGGVSVSAASQSATTGSSGDYSFANVPAGTHSVQISGAPIADVAFTSTTISVTIATSGQMATADFSGTYIRTSTITGSVTAGDEGVMATVTATGTGMLTDEEPAIGSSDADGNFELPGLRAGSWMVTISDYPEGIEFTFTTRNVTVGVGVSAPVSFDAPGEDGPTTGTGVSIIITGVTGADDKIAGRLTATIDVERGEFEKIALYVAGNDMAVDSILFGLGRAPAEGPELATQQGGVEFKLSFDSDEYDDETGAVTYPNEAYELVAGVTLQGSTEVSYSNRMEVEFENSSFVLASVNGLGDGARNSSTGRVWYGGPDVSVEISALAVSYSSGAAVSSVTLLQFCEDDAATDSEAPFSFPVDCDGFQSGDEGTAPMFNVGGADIGSRGGKVYLDFKAPDAPHFRPNPNKREGGWVNADVGFTDEYKAESGKRDGWLIYHHDDNMDNLAADGVGEYTPRIRFAEAGDDDEVGGAVDATAWTQVVLPPALAGQSSKADEYCVVVSAVDMLGNESKLPDADDACVKASDYNATDADNSAGLLVGVDLQDPTIDFSPASPKADAATMKDFQVQLADEGSGIRDNDPLDVVVNLRNAKDDEKIKDLEIDVSLPLATTDGLPSGIGYYTFTATVSDKAGNSSDEATRTALHDDVAPMVSTIVGEYNGKTGEYSMVATVTDNLSIKEYWAEMRFGDGDLMLGTLEITENGRFLPREGGVGVDAYNARDLTQSTLAPSLMAHSFRALQSGTTFENLSSIQVFARDHAGVVSAGAASPVDPVAPDLGEADGFDLSAATIPADADVEGSDRKVFQTFVVTAEEDGGTVEIEATASGTLFEAPTPEVPEDPDTEATEFVAGEEGQQGLRDNPISRVDFYAAVNMEDGSNGRDALKFIGSVPGASAGAEDEVVDGTAMRNYIYSMEMSAADFLAIVGGKGDYGEADGTDGNIGADEGAIVAFAVSDNMGVALYAPPVALVVEK